MNPLMWVVALVAAGLAGVVGFEALPLVGEVERAPAAASAPEAGPSDTPVTAAPAVSAAAPTFSAATNDTLLARPLFSQTRRPPDVAGPAATEAVSATPLPRMTAILIDGSNRRAIFAGNEGGKAVTVVEGGHVGAFTVQSIAPQQVTLVGPDGPRTVRTTFDPALQAPAALPGAAFTQPQFPGIQLPGMQTPNLPIPPYSQPATPAFGAGNGPSPGAAR